MESVTSKGSWNEAEPAELKQAKTPEALTHTINAETKHDQILEKLDAKARGDPNTLGFIVIGSVATRTHHENSDIDVITIMRAHSPSSGINKTVVDGVMIDSLYFTQGVLTHSVNTVPYLLHTLVNSRLLFDRENTVKPLIEEVKHYFAENPELVEEWNSYFQQSNEIKQQTVCRARNSGKTIIDVWNELERRYSDGKIKRSFFNSFYLTNPHMFSLVKRFLS